MKKTYFKIIELDTHQVLVSKDFEDDKESSPSIVIILFHEGVKIKQTLIYSNEQGRDEDFIIFDVEQAKIVLESIKKFY